MQLKNSFAGDRKMTKDFKIGLFVGLVLVSIAGIWLCVSPTVSVKSRLGNLLKAKTPAQPEEGQTTPVEDSNSTITQPGPQGNFSFQRRFYSLANGTLLRFVSPPIEYF